MSRKFVGLALGLLLCLTVSFAQGKPGGGKPGAGKPPGGNWSEGKPASGGARKEPSEEGAGKKKPPETSGAKGAAAGAAATGRNEPKTTGAKGAAAGAAATDRNEPKTTGTQGAAAGAAAADRNAPKTSGAKGAAAGAAAVDRNAPKATGAQGAAAGAAAASRNAPKATGAQGAAAGAAVADRNAPKTTGAAGAAAGYAAVRNSFDRTDLYGADWHGDHPGAWTAAGWAAGAAYTPTVWGAAATHMAYGNVTPISYNYGSNVTCVDGNVMLDGNNIGTAEDFSQQAADLAQTGADAKTDETDKWLPLGVFAMVRNEQQHPQLILQLAVNQNGVLRGNYTDEVTDHTLPIHGAVDQKSQRAAWTVGGNTSSVMEVGLNNLTQGEAPALLHKNGKTDRWILVRLPEPK